MRREEFIHRFQTMIQDSGIKQAVLARALGLSSASISQFGHAMALPKLNQFEAILDLLDISDEQRQFMTEKLITLREEYGLGANDEDTFAWQDEPDNETSEDDEDSDLVFTDSDDPDSEEDDDDYDDDDDETDGSESDGLSLYRNAEYDFSDGDTVDSDLTFSEPIDAIPIMDLEDLRSFRKGSCPFQNFAYDHCEDISFRDYGAIPAPVIIKAMGSQLRSAYKGMVQLLVSEEITLPSSMMHLALDTAGKFHLIADSIFAKANGLDSLVSKNTNKSEAKNFRWMLPVVEFSIIPLTKDMLNIQNKEDEK